MTILGTVGRDKNEYTAVELRMLADLLDTMPHISHASFYDEGTYVQMCSRYCTHTDEPLTIVEPPAPPPPPKVLDMEALRKAWQS